MKIFLKELISIVFLVSTMAAVSCSGEIALVYESELAATQGKFFIASLVPEGVLVSAQFALKSGSQMLVGPMGNSVYHAKLVRLDNELDLAVVRLGEPLTNSEVNLMHQKKSKAILDFLPQAASKEPSAGIQTSAGAGPSASGPLALKINGISLDSGSVQLKSNSLRKSKFKLEVVVLSTAPVWNLSLDLKSDPQLSFWKVGRTTSLNEIPRPNFHYDHQALFKPLVNGSSIVIPVEAHFIDIEKSYLWTIEVKTKQGSLSRTVNIIFQK